MKKELQPNPFISPLPKVIDPGHRYLLLSLDGVLGQELVFVKRFDPEHPEKYPGNTSAYPGTNLQSVIRCLIDRLMYLHNQIPHKNNLAVMTYLGRCLWLLEDRAAERHGYSFDYRPEDMVLMPLCAHCGHVVCEKLGNAHR